MQLLENLLEPRESVLIAAKWVISRPTRKLALFSMVPLVGQNRMGLMMRLLLLLQHLLVARQCLLLDDSCKYLVQFLDVFGESLGVHNKCNGLGARAGKPQRVAFS